MTDEQLRANVDVIIEVHGGGIIAQPAKVRCPSARPLHCRAPPPSMSDTHNQPNTGGHCITCVPPDTYFADNAPRVFLSSPYCCCSAVSPRAVHHVGGAGARARLRQGAEAERRVRHLFVEAARARVRRARAHGPDTSRGALRAREDWQPILRARAQAQVLVGAQGARRIRHPMPSRSVWGRSGGGSCAPCYFLYAWRQRVRSCYCSSSPPLACAHS